MIKKVEFPTAVNKIIVNLDGINSNLGKSRRKAASLIEFFSMGNILPYIHSVKVGPDFLMLYSAILDIIFKSNVKAFLDGKFFSDPNGILRMAENIFASGAKMFSVQASLGAEIMKSIVLKMEEMAIAKVITDFLLNNLKLEASNIPAKIPKGMKTVIETTLKNKDINQNQIGSAIKIAEKNRTMIIVETVPPFYDEKLCHQVFSNSIRDTLKKFIGWTKNAGLDGIICSSKNLKLLDRECLKDLFVIVPDTVPEWVLEWILQEKEIAERHSAYIKYEENMPMTPAEAFKSGASAVILGQSLINPPPIALAFADALEKTAEEIHRAFKIEMGGNEDSEEDSKTIMMNTAKK